RAQALHHHVDFLQAVLHALARGAVGRHLRGERRRLSRALEARAAGRLPRDDVALAVGQRDDRVVEARFDVGDADGDVLADTATAAAPGWTLLGHQCFLVFFLPPAEAMRLGPLR